MNFVDLLFIMIFFGILVLGFFQGVIRLTVLVIAFYLALVLASLYYAPIGEIFVRNFHSQRFVAQYTAFFLVLLLGFILVTFAGFFTFRELKLPGGLRYFDQILGTLLGLFLGALVVGVSASLLWNLMMVHGGRNIDIVLFQMLGDSIDRSMLVRYFSTTLLPLAYNRMAPFLPDGADLLFLIQ
jgi:membrane protein required for colicin V production